MVPGGNVRSPALRGKSQQPLTSIRGQLLKVANDRFKELAGLPSASWPMAQLAAVMRGLVYRGGLPWRLDCDDRPARTTAYRSGG